MDKEGKKQKEERKSFKKTSAYLRKGPKSKKGKANN
jgi:hypothetical protein